MKSREDINRLLKESEESCQKSFERIDRISIHGTKRVLKAMQRQRVATRHFASTTGYGYDDVGRDTLEKIFAELFGCEAAIVRPHITSGTHALALCFFGLMRPGDHLLYATGAPYDTLSEVIGLRGDSPGSLREMGCTYGQVELSPKGEIDLEAIRAAILPHTRVIVVQRSKGYSLRRSLMPRDFEGLSTMLKKDYPHIVLMADNCYGEFVCETEPSHHGADVCVGSLIKNPGGGIAPTGGYIVGRKDLIERISYRLTAPGIGLEVGSYAAGYQPFYQGLFVAPHVVGQALKTATLAAAIFEKMGMKTTPSVQGERSDIIQAIILGEPERLIAFCQGIQMASPVDSMALPEPWDMPGYQHQVIMAAGTFVSGASIELSADAPMREPYAVYLQGGLTFCHGKVALQMVLETMHERDCF